MKPFTFSRVFLSILFFSSIGFALSCTPRPDQHGMGGRDNLKPPGVQAMVDTSMNWADMDHDQRLQFMKQVVMPKMRAEFAGFDPNQYGKINCMTCHGDGAKDGTFTMPNPKLYKLPNNADGFKALMNDKPKIFGFMAQTVKPEMASMLHMAQFDPATHTGFGCGNCHTTE